MAILATILYSLIILSLYITFSNAQIQANSNGGCKTYLTNENGFCVPIRECSFIVNLINQSSKPLPSNVVNYLTRSYCGTDQASHKICCSTRHLQGSSSRLTATPTPTTTTTTKRALTNNINADILINDFSRHRNINLLPLDTCGRSSQDKLSNGNVTSLGEFPWMVLLEYITPEGDLQFQCGGALISKRYILTAAHCVSGIKSRLYSVRIGEHDTNKDVDCERFNDELFCLPAPQNIRVQEIIPHPQYVKEQFSNDIALIRLSQDAIIQTESANPVCLPITSQIQRTNLLRAFISGWGITEKSKTFSDTSNILLKAVIPIVHNNVCQNAFPNDITMTIAQMCAGGENGVDSCRGDSGGPLFFTGLFRNSIRYVQYGVVSAGAEACSGTGTTPAVYTRVSHYMQWILDQLKP